MIYESNKKSELITKPLIISSTTKGMALIKIVKGNIK